VNRKVLEALVHSGSFDEFGEDRAVLLASLDVAAEHAQLVKPEDDQFDFFEDDEFFPKPKYTQVDPIRPEDKLKFEKEVLGLYLSDHPVSVYEPHFALLGAVPLLEFEPSSKKARAVVYVSDVKKIRTKKGEPMAFLSLSDQSGDMEAVVFPKIFNRYSALCSQGNIIFLEGKMEEREGNRQLIVQHLEAAKEAIERMENMDPVLYLRITKEKEAAENLRFLKELFKKNEGSIQVVLYYESSQKSIRLGEEDLVYPSDEFMNQLINLLGKNNVILK
jgi:DNA polymerase-3 subunit alpha